MTTIDRIRREIERRKVDALDKGFTFVPAALQDLLSFLDTLPDEPVTDCHELKEAAENPYVLNDVSHAAFEYERTRNDLDARSDNEVVRRAFIAGAEWGAEHLAGVRKMISDDLEEAAMNYIAPIENEDGLKVINFSGQDVADAFEAGAEWQKKQFEKKES